MTPIIETTCAWGKERTPGGWCMLESGGVGRLGVSGLCRQGYGRYVKVARGQGWVDVLSGKFAFRIRPHVK
jgi:hypothetical protein